MLPEMDDEDEEPRAPQADKDAPKKPFGHKGGKYF